MGYNPNITYKPELWDLKTNLANELGQHPVDVLNLINRQDIKMAKPSPAPQLLLAFEPSTRLGAPIFRVDISWEYHGRPYS